MSIADAVRQLSLQGAAATPKGGVMNVPVSFRQLGPVLLVLAGLCTFPGATRATNQSAVDDIACEIVAILPITHMSRSGHGGLTGPFS